MNKPALNPRRIVLAFAIAILTDAIELPFNAAFGTFFLAPFVELLIVGVDLAAMILINRLIGFNPMLLPSLAIEITPGLDLFPTWTGYVAFVVWQRRRSPTATAHVQNRNESASAPSALSSTPLHD